MQLRDPIEVTDRDGVMNVVVEGRHRKEAYELNNVAEIKVKVLEFDDEAEMIAYAYKANTGGSLPPTPQDTEHTIMLLLEHGETMKRIGELLGLPAGMARKYISSVKSKTSRQKLMKAAAAVTDGGLTVAKAAEQYEVDADALRTSTKPTSVSTGATILMTSRLLSCLFIFFSFKVLFLAAQYRQGQRVFGIPMT